MGSEINENKYYLVFFIIFDKFSIIPYDTWFFGMEQQTSFNQANSKAYSRIDYLAVVCEGLRRE